MTVRIHKNTNLAKYPYQILDDTDEEAYILLSKEGFIDLYKQLQSMIIDEVIEEYDPDKKRAENEDNMDKKNDKVQNFFWEWDKVIREEKV